MRPNWASRLLPAYLVRAVNQVALAFHNLAGVRDRRLLGIIRGPIY